MKNYKIAIIGIGLRSVGLYNALKHREYVDIVSVCDVYEDRCEDMAKRTAKRDIERADLTGEVRGRMNRYAEQLLRGTVLGYNTVSVKNMNVNVQKSHWEYSLLPIWVLTYRGRDDKTYTYAMNGYTGKVYGELPVSFAKLGLLLGAVAVPLTVILTVLGGLLF